MARIIGLLFSAAAVRLASMGIALYVGYTVATYLAHTLNQVNTALSVLG